MATHQVTNQPPPYDGRDAFADDVVLRDAVARHDAGWADDDLHATGRLVGDAGWADTGRLANEHPPVLHTHDRWGHRVDRVEYHPAYHRLLAVGVAHGLHAAPWADDRPGAHVARAARYVLWPQVDSGTLCPLTMTYAVVPSLRHQPELAAAWEPLATSPTYDPTFGPALGGAEDERTGKAGALFGMAMTEKQGGSDLRANTTRAVPVDDGASTGDPGSLHRLTGHKWFCSAPMNDAFLVLATLDPATPDRPDPRRRRPDPATMDATTRIHDDRCSRVRPLLLRSRRERRVPAGRPRRRDGRAPSRAG